MATKRGGKSGRRPRADRAPRGGEAVAASEAGQSTRWWWRLSGRGRWLALAGLVGALAGAAGGWWGIGQTTYRAEGTVRLGAAHAGGEAAGVAESLRMDEVVEREIAELRRSAGSPSRKAEGVVIDVRRAEDAQTRIDLVVTADNADAATAAVRSVLADYTGGTALGRDADQAEAWNQAVTHLNGLRAEAAAARSRLAETRAAIRDNRAADEAGYTGPITEVDPAWSAALWTQNEARRATQVVSKRLGELQGLAVPEVEQVAALDPEAAGWWGRVKGLNARLAEAVWPPNPAMAERLSERIALEAQLQARAQDTRLVPLGGEGLAFRAVRLSETEAQLEQLVEAQAAAEARVAELEPRLRAWRDLNARVQQVEARLAMQEAAVGELDPGSGVRLIEAAPGGDAVVWRDDRATMAAVGGVAGFGAGVLLCAVVFVFDQRVRRSRDGGLVGSAVPVLGTVPLTDERPTGADHAAADGGQPMEVASIQAVRAVLESHMRPAAEGQSPGGAFAVTGIASGSGATSAAVGLAVSMALSGSRVLLIDLAWLQKPAGSGTDDDAARAGLGVDGVIEELGYLDDEDREAIALGDEGETGFGAILSGRSLRRSVVQTRVAGLGVLSAMGRAEALRAEWAGRVSSRWLRKLMEVSRRGGYTATILDAGSATGSVEGMLGCAAADGTVVVVSGDQTQADYDKAVTRLRLVGATILGTVLNRSDAKRLGGKRGSGTVRRANAAGGTTGSGIFAAAIEARSGGRGDGGSGMFTAPLPRVEDETPPEPPEEAIPTEAPAAVEPQPTPIEAAPEAEAPSIPAGVDPFTEPPAEVQPTPTRQPPARPTRATPLPPGLSPEAIAESFSTDAAPPQPTSASPPTDPPPADAAEQPEPEIHVSDDVMDQLVDHAIRAAQRPRAQRPTPPQDTSS